MTQADLSKLDSLSLAQQEALSDDQKALYCLMSEADQAFFAETFKPQDLPKALDRKAEIMLNNQASRDRLAKLKGMIAERAQQINVSGEAVVNDRKSEDIITTITAAVGVGAAAAAIATDNTARWQGVWPRDLVAPLEKEFENQEKTDIDFEGTTDALEGTVFVSSGKRFVPALTINLTRIGDGVEVKMGDLTSRGFLETLRGGGEKLLSLAYKGLVLWNRRGWGNPVNLIGMANSALSDTAGLAELAGNLKIKDRAWNVIKNTATQMEKNYQDRLAQERQARYALERAWDQYYACPTCAVPFSDEEKTCRVCGTTRPEQPMKPDPRRL